jgi:hypothetical protein
MTDPSTARPKTLSASSPASGEVQTANTHTIDICGRW